MPGSWVLRKAGGVTPGILKLLAPGCLTGRIRWEKHVEVAAGSCNSVELSGFVNACHFAVANVVAAQ